MPKNNNIQIDTSVVFNDKIESLTDDCGLEGFGFLVMLWAYTALEYPDGNIPSDNLDGIIKKFSKLTHAEQNRTKRTPVPAVQKDWLKYFVDKKWIEKKDDNNYYIHDWAARQPHIIKFLAKMKATKEARQKAGKASGAARKAKQDEPKKEKKKKEQTGNKKEGCSDLFNKTNTCSPNLTYPNLLKDIKETFIYLNGKTGRRFEFEGKRGENNRELVKKLFEGEYSLEEIKLTIDHQVSLNNNQEGRKYLEPICLFRNTPTSPYPFSSKCEQAKAWPREEAHKKQKKKYSRQAAADRAKANQKNRAEEKQEAEEKAKEQKMLAVAYAGLPEAEKSQIRDSAVKRLGGMRTLRLISDPKIKEKMITDAAFKVMRGEHQ